MSLVSVRKLASRERVGGEKRVAVKPLLNVQCPPMSLEKVWQAILRQFWRYVRPRVNPKDGFDFNEILWSFLDQSRSGAKNYERDHPLPLAWRPFTVVFLQRKGYYSFQNGKINSTREAGFHLSLELKKRCIVGKKRATEVS